MPDSVFFPEQVSADYPYSADGGRFWEPDTPFVDPFVGISAMMGVTERIRFVTNVVKLPIRDPLLVSKQLSSMAALSGNRMAIGVGLSWIPEEFAWTHTDMRTRGRRADEMIEIIKLICAGRGPEWVEYHGEFYDFDRLMMAPAPDAPLPIYVGGLSEPGFGAPHGWPTAGSRSRTPRPRSPTPSPRSSATAWSTGEPPSPFEINALCTDVFDLDGFHRLAEAGVTELQVVPWYFTGQDPDDLANRIDSLAWWADEIMAKF